MIQPAYTPDRRPLASRHHPLAIRLAGAMARRGISPNAISLSGMLAGILAGLAFVCTNLPLPGWICFLIAAALMQLRLLANMLDGMVAVQTGQASPLGELFNEVPDRVSDTAIFIGAGYAAGGIPEWGYLAAIASLFTAYVRAQGCVAGAPQDFRGPLAKPQRMALLTVAAAYAGLAPSSWQFQYEHWPAAGTLTLALIVITLGATLTAVRRLVHTARLLKTISMAK